MQAIQAALDKCLLDDDELDEFRKELNDIIELESRLRFQEGDRVVCRCDQWEVSLGRPSRCRICTILLFDRSVAEPCLATFPLRMGVGFSQQYTLSQFLVSLTEADLDAAWYGHQGRLQGAKLARGEARCALSGDTYEPPPDEAYLKGAHLETASRFWRHLS